MANFHTVPELLQVGDENAIALAAPERTPLSYGQLRSLVHRTVERLNEIGIGRNDRVALVVKNGPEMASAFLSVCAAATACPLNPNYHVEQFEFYLADLRPRALVIEAGVDSPSRIVAQHLGIPLLELCADRTSPAGAFTLDGAVGGPTSASTAGAAGPDDIALLLHTSGTTARPNIVPLSQRNVASSARQIRGVLNLQPSDRCLNIMPLFHIHGLMAAVSASLAGGASVFCAPGFNALRFFLWVDEGKPTWYTAVPTMHQAILGRARRRSQTIDFVKLRFIRSGSASLPPPVMKQMEETFRTPVIESYGMTEATHQIASNPLPPKVRKPGSVGLAIGTEVAVMDGAGNLLPAHQPGEVVIRGENVTRGYESNPEANARAFRDGWFHTGDQGFLDEEGYLRLTGRLKELINRGGEKISPLEVDAVLLSHPAIAQAVTFAIPHAKLGEEVGAAIVLREGQSLTDRELKEFAGAHLPDFKVPRKMLFLTEIPKGATGKVQRIGLAERLGLGEKPT